MGDAGNGAVRILLIEAGGQSAAAVERILERLAHSYEVNAVPCVDDSVPLLDQQQVDLILLDVEAPGGAQYEAFGRLRAQSPDVPIIILADEEDATQAREALRRGAQDYLVKDSLEGNLLLHAIQYATERHAVHQELEDLSLRDPLTGLYNRRGFVLLAEQSLRLAKRNGRESVLLLADVDDLKIINDTHGHMAGDQGLCAVARAFTSAMRESDIVSRLAGDEFVALAVEAHPPGIGGLVERFNDHLSTERSKDKAIGNLSVSIGMAPFDPQTAPTLADLMHTADEDMYTRKRVSKRGGT